MEQLNIVNIVIVQDPAFNANTVNQDMYTIHLQINAKIVHKKSTIVHIATTVGVIRPNNHN